MIRHSISRFTLQLEHLYLLLALSGVGFLVAISPVLPHDFWWHLRVGQVISEEGRIPQSNLFAWTLPADAPYVYAAWLGDWLLYQLHRVGGVELVLLSRNLLVLATFGLLAHEAQRRSGSVRIAALATAIAGVMSLNNLDARPQMWAWLPFTLHVVLLSRYVAGALPRRWLLLLPLLEVFWVNVHGSFVLGIALILGTLIGEVLGRLRSDGRALDWPALRWLAAVALAEIVAVLANPRGTDVVGYIQALIGNGSVRMLAEWSPPVPGSIVSNVFFGSVLLLLMSVAFARRRPTVTDVLIVSGLAWLAWSAQRNVLWFGIAAMPVLAQCLGTCSLFPVRAKAGPTSRQRPIPRIAPIANGLLAVLIATPLVLAQPWLVRTLPDAYLSRMLAPPVAPLLSTETPVAAADYLARNPGGRLFNEMGYGSYLIWAVPGQKVFADPRVELFPAALWTDYLAASRGDEATTILDRYGVDRVLLSREGQAALAASLAREPGWSLEYVDAWSEVWRKDSVLAASIRAD
jgi:hypothetical protein